MAGVRQVRVLLNVVCILGLCVLMLWLVRTRLWEHCLAWAIGGGAGVVFGPWRWWRLQRRIARRDRRYERNKIFVHYLNSFEVIVAVLAYNPYMAIPLGGGLLGLLLLTHLSAHWWMVLGASFGVLGAGILAGCVLCYERRYGPLYYQYNSETWSGAEGLLYQVGTVVQPLTPTGKVALAGALWNAVSRSGEPIDIGWQVEVLSVDRLTLSVDRLPAPSAASQDGETT